MAIPAMALLQQHNARRDILIEPVAQRDRSSEAFRTGGIQNCGRNRAVKTNRLVNNEVSQNLRAVDFD